MIMVRKMIMDAKMIIPSRWSCLGVWLSRVTIVVRKIDVHQYDHGQEKITRSNPSGRLVPFGAFFNHALFYLWRCNFSRKSQNLLLQSVSKVFWSDLILPGPIMCNQVTWSSVHAEFWRMVMVKSCKELLSELKMWNSYPRYFPRGLWRYSLFERYCWLSWRQNSGLNKFHSALSHQVASKVFVFTSQTYIVDLWCEKDD